MKKAAQLVRLFYIYESVWMAGPADIALPVNLSDAGRVNQAIMIGQQDQQKQGNGKTDPERQGFHRAIAFSLVFH